MNAQKYCQLLEVLTEYEDEKSGLDWTFQQDNTAIHLAKLTKFILQEQERALLDWPTISPDLKPIDNAWALLSSQDFT